MDGRSSFGDLHQPVWIMECLYAESVETKKADYYRFGQSGQVPFLQEYHDQSGEERRALHLKRGRPVF